ncbi:MAG: DUF3108 domain-containing protein [Desulfobacteraceae bacterium]|jgi:hypothetical protein|nr:MAG: DUF3108 domain-containing protein [Desulfobacteraceae bacterium]
MKITNHVKFKPLFQLIAILMAILLAGSVGWADKIPVDQVKISTPVYTPDLSAFAPKMGTYTYRVSWKGIPAGTVEMELARNGSDYEIRVKAYTVKFIDTFFKLRYSTEAVISAETLLPKHSVSSSRENKRHKESEMTFLPDGTVHSISTDNRGRVESIEFEPDNFTLDPYSAAFMALAMDWEVGDTRQFDTFNGKNRYLIELTATKRTTIRVDSRSREAIVIVPTVQKLTDTDLKKLKRAEIYISADIDREILKISSDLMIGSVDTDMVDFEPAAHTQIAEKTERRPEVSSNLGAGPPGLHSGLKLNFCPPMTASYINPSLA